MNNSVERDDFLSPAAPSYAEATYSDTYDNPFETNIPQRMNSPSIEPDDVPLPGQKPLSPTKAPLPKVSGNIGSSSTSASASNNIGSSNASRGVGLGVGQAMMGGVDTLDEPVSETLVRTLLFYRIICTALRRQLEDNDLSLQAKNAKEPPYWELNLLTRNNLTIINSCLAS